ncbi:DUF1937 family protein [Thioclava sp. BHET1]|nr:DUF1937 family protein [Thioclava sp. BHET1]
MRIWRNRARIPVPAMTGATRRRSRMWDKSPAEAGPSRVSFLIPKRPDWPWLLQRFAGTGLLFADMSLDATARATCGGLVHLSAPYARAARGPSGSWCPVRSQIAVADVASWAVSLAELGCTPVAPVVLRGAMLATGIAGYLLDPLDRAFWWDQSRAVLAAAAAVVIPPLAGWSESEMVWREACTALRHNKRVYLIAEDGGPSGQGAMQEGRESNHAD